MLLKEFLEDTVDDINEKDFIDLKNQINDLTKFKEAAQEKIKTDVNYEDINKLTTELTNLGIKYESYNNFYDKIVKYFKSDNAYARKLLNNNFKIKYPDDKAKDPIRKEIDLVRKLNNDIVNNAVADLDNKENELNHKIEVKKDELSNYEKENGSRYILEEMAEQLIKENKDLFSELGSMWVLYYFFKENDKSNFSMDKHTFNYLKSEKSSFGGYGLQFYLAWDLDILLNVKKLSDYEIKKCGECKKKMFNFMREYLREEKNNLDYSIPFDKWKHFQIKAALSTIKFLEALSKDDFSPKYIAKLENKEEYDNNISQMWDEISNLSKNELSNIWDERQLIRDEIYNSEEYVKNYKKQKELEDLLYYHIDMDYVRDYAEKKYLQYLITECLNPYIEELKNNLQIVQGRFGIGKGTGSALTRFRHYEENVNNLLTESEKAYFMGWLCKHIRGMMVYVMPEGSSERVFNLLFPNVKNYNTSVKSSDNAWDARSGEIIIDSEESISPQIQKLFNKLTSNKTQVGINNMEQESGRFKGNKLNSAPLVYLLLNEYYNFGFTLGNISIDPDQAYELQRNKFYQNEEDFDRGYNS